MKALHILLKPLMMALAMCLMLSGCAVVGGIFKTGFYAGIFVVIFVIGLIVYFLMRSRRSNNP